MKITLENGKKLEIAIKDKSGKIDSYATEILLDTFKTSLLHAATWCSCQGWDPKDYDALYDALKEMHAILI